MEGSAVLTIAKSKKATKALKLKPASARRFRAVSGMVISHRVACGTGTLTRLGASLSSVMADAGGRMRLASMGQQDCLRASSRRGVVGGDAGQIHARTRVHPKPRDEGVSL